MSFRTLLAPAVGFALLAGCAAADSGR
ncbi:MAG: hypothetical protein QOG84_2772, partial [Sphingomonadales bacterium]|nr:hypothetical protein [Sphingomonadales bacterium]